MKSFLQDDTEASSHEKHSDFAYKLVSHVLQVSWAPTPVPADDSERPIYLASADTTGFIVVFDVTAGKDKQRLCEANKVVNGK